MNDTGYMRTYFEQNLSKQCSHSNDYYPTILKNIRPRRNSYQIAVHTTANDQIPFLCSTASSLSSFDDYLNRERLYRTLHNNCSHCFNEHFQRNIQYSNNDLLLEHATYILDSPVHALRLAHYKSRGRLSPKLSLPIENSIFIDKSNDENNASTISLSSIYRTVFLRSFASILALASLFTTETIQTSIYSIEQSFQSLLTLHLSSTITAFLLVAHVSHINISHYDWKISSVLAYDRCSRILIVFATLLTSTWVSIQYFHIYHRFVLLAACLSGISLSLMIIKTYEHLFQLSITIGNGNKKYLHRFLLIYNTLCHLSLTIGGFLLICFILFQQWKSQIILIGHQSCFLIQCLHINNNIENDEQIFKPIPKLISINLTVYFKENKQIWSNQSFYYIIFFILTLISLIIQLKTKWTTSIKHSDCEISLFYYLNNDKHEKESKLIQYRSFLIALFIGFQEGLVFSSVIKFNITCLYGLRHTSEMLIIYGLASTMSSFFLSLIMKYLKLMISVTLTTLIHIITIILLYFIQNSNQFHLFHPFMLKYILFLFYGTVIGLWSTILTNSTIISTKCVSFSIFAQTLAFRYLGRIIAYTCTLLLCQTILFYIDSISLLFIFSCIFICYWCCNP